MPKSLEDADLFQEALVGRALGLEEDLERDQAGVWVLRPEHDALTSLGQLAQDSVGAEVGPRAIDL